jgi:hypothetical protein
VSGAVLALACFGALVLDEAHRAQVDSERLVYGDCRCCGREYARPRRCGPRPIYCSARCANRAAQRAWYQRSRGGP